MIALDRSLDKDAGALCRDYRASGPPARSPIRQSVGPAREEPRCAIHKHAPVVCAWIARRQHLTFTSRPERTLVFCRLRMCDAHDVLPMIGPSSRSAVRIATVAPIQLYRVGNACL